MDILIALAQALDELGDEIDIQRRALAKLQQEVAANKKKIGTNNVVQTHDSHPSVTFSTNSLARADRGDA